MVILLEILLTIVGLRIVQNKKNIPKECVILLDF